MKIKTPVVIAEDFVEAVRRNDKFQKAIAGAMTNNRAGRRKRAAIYRKALRAVAKYRSLDEVSYRD